MSQVHCLRCGYHWYPYTNYFGDRKPNNPKRCASCRTPYWNKPVSRNRRQQSRQMKAA